MFAELGLEAPLVIPGPGRCPACLVPELFIYQDTRQDGGWCRCRRCGCTGDAFDLAAAAWRVSRASAIQRLCPTATQANTENHPRLAAEAFWAVSRARVPQVASLLSAVHGALATADLRSASWPERGGCYLGAATREQLDAWLATRRRAAGLFPSARCNEDDQLSNWQEVAVMPCHDLPGRLTAFLLAVRNGCERNVVYLPVDAPRRRRPFIPPGLIGLDALLATSGRALVMLDPLSSVRLHLRRLQTTLDPLPLAGVWPAAPPANFLTQLGERLIFWAPQPDADLFRHARAAQGWITDGKEHTEGVRERLRRMKPLDWVETQLARPKPWRVVLEETLAQRTIAEANLLLAQLHLPVDEWHDFVAGCRRSLRRHLEAQPPVRAPNRVVASGRTLLETADGWRAENNGELVAGCLLRIKRVVALPDGDSRYEGVVSFQGVETPFSAPGRIFAAKPLCWLRDFLIAAGQGYLVYAPRWETTVLNVAVQLHPPELIRGGGRPGWNKAESCWVLSDCALAMGGEILPRLVLEGYPSIARPEALPAEAVAALDASDAQADLAWAVALTILHNVLAPAYRYDPTGMVLTGELASAARGLAAQSGCSLVQPRSSGRDVFAPVYHEEAAAGWPVLLPLEPDPGASLFTWLARPNHNCFLQTNWWLSRLLFLRGGWLRLDGHGPRTVSPAVAEASARLIPSFLLWLSRRHLQRTTTASDPLLALTNDLANWFCVQGGDASAVAGGRRLLEVHGEATIADDFIDVVGRLYEEGQIRLAWLEDAADLPLTRDSSQGLRKAPVLLYDRTEQSVWMSPAYLNVVLRRLGQPSFDVEWVRAGLLAAGRLLGERAHDGQNGWAVAEDWWTQRLKFSQAARRNDVRIAEGS